MHAFFKENTESAQNAIAAIYAYFDAAIEYKQVHP